MMTTVILVIHVLLALAMIGVIMVQRSEGGALGGLGGGTMGGLMTGRGTANLLTRATAILAGCFLATSLALALLGGRTGQIPSILDLPATQSAPERAPATGPQPAAPATPAEPAAPAGPSAPVVR